MAYTTPTLAEFRALYPAFDAVADATVQAWLASGDTETARWGDDDRPSAVMLYAAHSMAEMGLGTAGAVPMGVTSFKSGTFSATVSDMTASRTGFSATAYGRRYLDLMRRNFAGPISAWTPPAAIDA